MRTYTIVAKVDLTIKMGTALLEAALAQHVDLRSTGLGCATTKNLKKKKKNGQAAKDEQVYQTQKIRTGVVCA